MCRVHSIGSAISISVLNLVTKEEFNYFGAVNSTFHFRKMEYALVTIAQGGLSPPENHLYSKSQ